MKTSIKITCLTTLMMSSGLQGMEDQNKQLFLAAKTGNIQRIEQLITNGADVNTQGENKITALMNAARHNQMEACKLLIRKKAEINAQDENGNTALIWAAKQGYKEICDLLITNGADTNYANEVNTTALLFAANYKHTETCKLLINAMIKLTPQERSQISTLLGLKKRNIPGLHPDTKKLIALEKLADIKREKKQNAREQIMKITNEELRNKLLKYLESIK